MTKQACRLLIYFFFLNLSAAETDIGGDKMFLDYDVRIKKENPDRILMTARIGPIPVNHLLLAMTQNYGRVETLSEIIPEISIYGAGRKSVEIKKNNEFLWEVDLPVSDTVCIDYAINTRHPYTSLNSVRLPYRDADHLYLPAASAFVHPDEKYLADNKIKIQRIRIHFDIPDEWTTATSWGSNRLAYELSPSSLETLNNGLIGAGCYRVHSFKVKELPVEVAILNVGPCPDEEIVRIVEQALIAGHDLFNFFPVSRVFALIQFIFDQPGRGSGNALGWSINLNYGRTFDSLDWIKETAHIFHEIFHFWNGTAISRAQSDHSLIWFTEGVTRFYQYKNMQRSGIISEEKYFQYISREYTDVFQSSRREDSLKSISGDYYADRSAMALTYSKGCCLAFALDLLLQHAFSGLKNFDSVMKKILEKYDFRVNRHCLTHDELDGVFYEILGKGLYPSYLRLRNCDFLQEFQSTLLSAGLEIEKTRGRRLYFGILDFGPPSDHLQAFKIDRESPAYQAGLREQDILLEINNWKVKDIPDVKKALQGMKENESANLIIERKNVKMRMRIPWHSFETRFNIKKIRNQSQFK